MSRDFAPISDDRALTDKERQLIAWMLEHGGPDAEDFQYQLQFARVVARCGCGCASIDLLVDGRPKPQGGMQIIADFLFGEEESLCGAFVFAQSGVLSGLEVYGLATDAPSQLPEPEDLRPIGK